MRKFGAFLVACVALTGAASIDDAKAASAEAAIKDWVAAIPTAEWTVTYGTIAYDAPTDRTTLTGLKATSAKANSTLAFNTIVITGYAPATDGSFSAADFSVDGGSVTSDKAKLSFAGFSATDFGSGPIKPFVYDKDRPFGSMIDAYRQVLTVHVKHAELKSVEFQDDADDTSFSYAGFTIDNWSNGKIADMMMGSMKLDFIDKDNGEPVHMEMAGFEGRDTDIDAFMRVYDVTRYQNGVGDMVWRPAIGLARYHGMSIQSTEFDVSLGEWSIENLRVRQPQRPFTAALEKVVKSGGEDLSPEGARALFDMYSAFALGKLTIADISVDADGGFGSLGAFTMKDFSADGLGEISIDDLDGYTLEGFARIGRLAAGDIVFPGMEKLYAAFEKGMRDQDVDFSELAAKLGYIEAANIAFENDTVPETSLDKFRLDLRNYVGIIPTDIGLDVAGLDAPAKLFDAGDGLSLADLNYDHIRADYGLKLAWNEKDKTITIGDFHLSLADVGNLSGNAVLSGLTREALSDSKTLPRALAELNLVSSSLTIEDKSLLNRYIAQQAYMLGIDQQAFREELAGSVKDMVDNIGTPTFQAKVADALRTYILRPGKLTVSAKPPDPVPVTGVAMLGAIFPATIPDVLGLDITVVAGPVPQPFDYVPPADPNTPDPDPGYRHVPQKKY